MKICDYLTSENKCHGKNALSSQSTEKSSQLKFIGDIEIYKHYHALL